MKRNFNTVLKLSRPLMLILFLVFSRGLAEGALRQKLPRDQFSQKSVMSQEERRQFKIKLQSRRFTPQEDISDALSNHIRPSRHERVHILMQFSDIPDKARKQFLSGAGVKLLNYIPNKAWFVSVPRSILRAQLKDANVRWIGPILPEDKIFTPLLKQGVSPGAVNADGSVNLEVFFFKDVSLDEGRTLMLNKAAVIKEEFGISNRLTITVSPDQLMDIAGEDIVRWINEERPSKIANNDGSRVNSGVEPLFSAPYNLSGAGVDVGIWDSGNVDSGHDDFLGRLTLAEAVSVSNHSTHVAGTMGGDGSRSLAEGGTAFQWKGMAPGMDIISYDFFNNLTEHDPAINTFAIELSQNSWGFDLVGPPASPQFYGFYGLDAPEYDDIITGLFGKRITVVFSAGNDRDVVSGEYDSIGPPGTGKNMITVGAIHSDDSTMTFFSSWGPMDDGRIKPDVVASGDEVGGDGGIKSSFPGNNYGIFIGTSMAAPAVSGLASIIIEDFRNIFSGADPLPSTVKALLIHEAVDLGNVGPDYGFGYGNVQVKDSIDKLRTESLIEDEVLHSETDIYDLSVPSGTTEVKVTLVWDDEPAVEGVAVTLINDLDLIVTDPGSTRHFPWTLDPAIPANPAVRTQEDHINNVEQVVVDTGIVSGSWTIEVVGTNVPVAPQKYSLIFTPNFGANLTGKIYNDAAFSNQDTFFDQTEIVYIEAFVEEAGSPVAGATVTAILKLVSDGSTVANIVFNDVGGGIYQNSWDSTGETAGVYTVDINVDFPAVTTQKKFHLYPLGGVSAYDLDYNEDGNDDHVLENKHLIAVYDGRENTDQSLLYLFQKDTGGRYTFNGIADPNTIGQGEISTTNLKGIKFRSFVFSQSGENLTSAGLNMTTEVIDPTEELITSYDLSNGASADARFFVDNGQWLAQRFDVTDLDMDFSLTRVEVFVDQGQRATNPLIVEIRADNGGVPDNTVLTSELMPAVSIPTTADWVNVVFTSPVTLQQGGLYWLVLRSGDSQGGGPHFVYTWTGDTTAPSYPGPSSFSPDQGANWFSDATDQFFRAFGIPLFITSIFDVSVGMNSENVDYLAYHLTNFDEFIDDINDIFVPISGSLGASVSDDRYHIGDGTDDFVNFLTSDMWTDFSGLPEVERYVAFYDASNSADAVNNHVISLISVPNANSLTLNSVGAWFETGNAALRIRYDTAGGINTSEVEYLLAFTEGDYSVIDQWMPTIVGGTFPTPNFMSTPSFLSLTVLPTAWSIGLVQEGQFTQSGLFTVTNDGTVNETFTLSIEGPSVPSSWLPSSSAGNDIYVMKGLFGPTGGDPTGLFLSDDVIDMGGSVAATGTQFGDAGLTPNGVNVEVSGQRGLWLEFQAPTTSSDNSEQTINVTVGAVQF